MNANCYATTGSAIRVSDCLGLCQEVRIFWFHVWLFFIIEFRIVRNFLMQAVMASFFGFPFSNKDR